jgi:hypothetical protein
MPRLTDFLRGYEPFERLVSQVAFGAGSHRAALRTAGVPSFVQAFALAGLMQRGPWSEHPVLVVAPTQEVASDLEHDLARYCPERRVLLLPPRGVWYGSEAGVKPRVAGRRARAVGALRGLSDLPGSPVVVVEAATLLEGVVPPVARPVDLATGGRHDFGGLIRGLVDLGYVRVDQVEDAGDFSVRGGLIDVFPSTQTYPVRIEFWGDEIESLRSFSVYSQRSLGPLDSVRLHAAAEEQGSHAVSLLSLLRTEAWVARIDPALAAAQVDGFQSDLEDVLGDEMEEGWYVDSSHVEEGLASHPTVNLSSLGLAAGEAEVPAVRAGGGGGGPPDGQGRVPGGHRIRTAGGGGEGRVRGAATGRGGDRRGRDSARTRGVVPAGAPARALRPTRFEAGRARRHTAVPPPAQGRGGPSQRGCGIVQLPRPAQRRLRGA